MFQKVLDLCRQCCCFNCISLGPICQKARGSRRLGCYKDNILFYRKCRFGPAGNQSHFEFNQKVTPEVVQLNSGYNSGVSRQVTNSYVSDDQGHVGIMTTAST